MTEGARSCAVPDCVVGASGARRGVVQGGMRSVLFSCFAALALAACQAGASAVEGGRQFGSGLGDAVSAPLEDLNLRRQQIPTVLLQAEANPYDLRHLDQCATIGAEIARLDEALGPDTDEPPPPDQPYLSVRAPA